MRGRKRRRRKDEEHSDDDQDNYDANAGYVNDNNGDAKGYKEGAISLGLKLGCKNRCFATNAGPCAKDGYPRGMGPCTSPKAL